MVPKTVFYLLKYRKFQSFTLAFHWLKLCRLSREIIVVYKISNIQMQFHKAFGPIVHTTHDMTCGGMIRVN